MSVSRSRGSTRGRLAVASVGALTAGLLAALPLSGAQGASPAQASASQASARPASAAAAAARGGTERFTDGRYIVLLSEASATGYAGGKSGYAATKSTGGQFRAATPAVVRYTDYLRTSQERVAGSVGASVDTSYTMASNGFAATLTAAQALDLATDRRVLLVEKAGVRKVTTWNTPDFLGLTGKGGAWASKGGRTSAGSGVVVGVLDTGIWPESKSFSGPKLTTRPQTPWDITMKGGKTRMEKADGTLFTGECETGQSFNLTDCNTKIISARVFGDAYLAATPESQLSEHEFISPRDGGGHGSHTASTAAGNLVKNVSTAGLKFGTISGMAPGARIAVYKVCWEAGDPDLSGCFTEDMVAAVDQLVIDGVDVVNFSIGGGPSPSLDATELAFEGAAEAGIFVAASAGNSGPDNTTLDHPSPWLTTVAAGTHTTKFENTIVLANGKKIMGASSSQTPVSERRIVPGSDAVVEGGDADDAALCGPDTLDPAKVAGKIVYCLRGVYDRVSKGAEVKRAGGAALIMANPSPNSLNADIQVVPTIHITDTAGAIVEKYVAAQGVDAKASFKLGNLTNQKTPLPQVAGFSSRGPVLVSDGDLLKPDIIAPGVDVLAAVAPPSNQGRTYDLYSGTSMSSPHIAGLAAFIQGERPKWTPMTIKSAMMTTATSIRNEKGGLVRDAFAQGAGQVKPKQFFDPGLFVTSDATQWRGWLADLGYNTGVPALDAKSINVPSLADGSMTGPTTFPRSFRASMKGTWKISADLKGFTVKPSRPNVTSKRANDIVDVAFTITRTTAPLGHYTSGFITLTGPTRVRIPVVVRPLSVQAPALVTGTGATGTSDVEIIPGFTGELDVTTSGLAKGETTVDTVDANADFLSCITVPEGSTLTQVDVDAADDTSDLDLYLLAAESCDPATAFAVAAQSATGAADESITAPGLPAGTYIVDIFGFAPGADGAPMGFTLDTYSVEPGAGLGAFTATPDPVPVVTDTPTSFAVSWTGLDPDAHYLGLVEYEGTSDITLVKVDTTG
ncbi:hypothetical protein NPS01_10760 [Nocardioides psychrotolerans]|uniref:Peptidase inhibitor I9 n=1 Tax=Nocardioides psychrotolerans TaxID=1005945 RepID=A0A1I3EDF9_9ACTN|nr:S8 family serine peptidase [Nocardioides psychrotolerans]GEP37413.1 hypothetical protein NPS01_10760 [Nocardioides psychrotolerans]SFH97017.1 Peptidase inhibitor I9 [Nocardioides psychrotolerans]